MSGIQVPTVVDYLVRRLYEMRERGLKLSAEEEDILRRYEANLVRLRRGHLTLIQGGKR